MVIVSITIIIPIVLKKLNGKFRESLNCRAKREYRLGT